MRPELDNYLVKKYPDIFSGRFESPQSNLMCFGFSCGDGWFHLIDNACALIVGRQKMIQDNNRTNSEWLKQCQNGEFISNFVQEQFKSGKLEEVQPIPDFKATQIKEKYGTLRFYYSGGDSYIDGVVSMAEAMSSNICEKCGARGILRGGSWVHTSCDEHKNSHELTEEEIYNSLEEGSYVDVLKKSNHVKEMCILEKHDDHFIMQETIYMGKNNPETVIHCKTRLIRTPVFSYMLETD